MSAVRCSAVKKLDHREAAVGSRRQSPSDQHDVDNAVPTGKDDAVARHNCIIRQAAQRKRIVSFVHFVVSFALLPILVGFFHLRTANRSTQINSLNFIEFVIQTRNTCI